MQWDGVVSGRVIVVGSGPAGCAAAASLSDLGADVLVLEAGARRSVLGLTARVYGMTVARWGPSVGMRRGLICDPDVPLYEDLALGGLSNHWSGAIPRLSPDDFADAERAGEAYTWPLGYDDIAPWYARVEPWLQPAGSARDAARLPAGKVSHAWELPSGWDPVVEESNKVGRSLVPTPYAFGARTTLSMAGTVFNAFTRLVRPRERAGRLAVRRGVRALRLAWSPDSKRVEAVACRDLRTGSEESIPCRAVVVAAGAVNTAQILLESASADFPMGLGNTHGVLGRYLHDHPLGKLVVDVARPVPMYPSAYLTRPDLGRCRPLYAGACLQWASAVALVRSALARRPGRTHTLGFTVFGTMKPTADDRVELDPAAGRVDGAAALRLSIRHPAAALEVLESTRDELLEILGRAGLAPRVRSWRIEPPLSSVHYGGTCRMHPSERCGMLNRFGRLHAVANVAVADSAAFTTGPEKNPLLTAMALAARAGDRLAHDLREGDL